MKKIIKLKALLWGTVSFFIILLLLSSIYSFLLLKDNFADSSVFNASFIILGISSFCSGLISGLLNKNKGIITGFITGALILLIITIISLCAGLNGELWGNEDIIKLIILFIMNILSAIIGVNVKKKY